MPPTPLPADPRPGVVDGAVPGSTCIACGHHAARRGWRCARCLGEVIDSSFGPGGVVWSAAMLHLRIGEREPPFVLAYVDLDAPGSAATGPRVLARVDPAVELPAGTRVTLVGVDGLGDLIVEHASDTVARAADDDGTASGHGAGS